MLSHVLKEHGIGGLLKVENFLRAYLNKVCPKTSIYFVVALVLVLLTFYLSQAVDIVLLLRAFFLEV